jgi:hypothetical protein
LLTIELGNKIKNRKEVEMASIQEIEDKLAIQELEARYCHAADFGDIETWVNCFTEDGILEGSLFTLKGSSALRDYISKRTKSVSEKAPKGCEHPFRHFVTNIVTEVQGDRATAKVYHMMLQVMQEGIKVLTTGISTDELHKIGKTWHIRHRWLKTANDDWARQLLEESHVNSLKKG